ncbi:MAG: GNAT family N-acetyltransferase [Ktedonobacterales bacterium]
MVMPGEHAITVRAASEADRAAAVAFISPAAPRGRASLALLRVGQGLLWVAVEDEREHEKLVGLLLATAQIDAESEHPAGYIQELLVHPAYRRLGVAMHLLDAAERFFLAEQGFSQVYLATSPDNEAALHLYRSRGYSVEQVRLTKARIATGGHGDRTAREEHPPDAR